MPARNLGSESKTNFPQFSTLEFQFFRYWMRRPGNEQWVCQKMFEGKRARVKNLEILEFGREDLALNLWLVGLPLSKNVKWTLNKYFCLFVFLSYRSQRMLSGRLRVPWTSSPAVRVLDCSSLWNTQSAWNPKTISLFKHASNSKSKWLKRQLLILLIKFWWHCTPY